MRFSDIHMIMIGEEGEYGRRLVRYLETHLSTAIRVYHFTTTESFLAFKERADIYLLDEAFFQRLSEEKQNVLLREKQLILLTAQEEEGTFCNDYHQNNRYNAGCFYCHHPPIIHFSYSYHNYLPEAQREHGRKFPTSFNFTAFIVLFNPLHPSVE